jgi:hypothetical protein
MSALNSQTSLDVAMKCIELARIELGNLRAENERLYSRLRSFQQADASNYQTVLGLRDRADKAEAELAELKKQMAQGSA